jgi:hypothetical protein
MGVQECVCHASNVCLFVCLQLRFNYQSGEMRRVSPLLRSSVVVVL